MSEKLKSRTMRPKAYFTHVGQGVFASVSTRTFHVAATLLMRFCDHFSKASAACAGSSTFGGGASASWLANLRPPVENALINCVSCAGVCFKVSTFVQCRPAQTMRMMPITTITPPVQKSWISGLLCSRSIGGCDTRCIISNTLVTNRPQLQGPIINATKNPSLPTYKTHSQKARPKPMKFLK